MGPLIWTPIFTSCKRGSYRTEPTRVKGPMTRAHKRTLRMFRVRITKYEGCSRGHNRSPIWNPMSILYWAQLSITLTVAHIPPGSSISELPQITPSFIGSFQEEQTDQNNPRLKLELSFTGALNRSACLLCSKGHQEGQPCLKYSHATPFEELLPWLRCCLLQQGRIGSRTGRHSH